MPLAVAVRRVEERDPEFQRTCDGREGLRLVGRPVELGHAHASEAERGDAEPRAEFTSLHQSLLGCHDRSAAQPREYIAACGAPGGEGLSALSRFGDELPWRAVCTDLKAYIRYRAVRALDAPRWAGQPLTGAGPWKPFNNRLLRFGLGQLQRRIERDATLEGLLAREPIVFL